MTDWSRLSHAYGSAEDIPALLDQIASDPAPERWNDLWSALCHQGSVRALQAVRPLILFGSGLTPSPGCSPRPTPDSKACCRRAEEAGDLGSQRKRVTSKVTDIESAANHGRGP
jgi:hypothetical protein